MRKKLLHFVERYGILSMIERLIEIIFMHEVKSMEILRTKIQGIRNISEAEIVFGQMTALVGLNGYGKSNILDAIDFGIDFIKYPPQFKNRVMSAKSNVPILKSNAGQNFAFEIELEIQSNNESFVVEYSYEFSWGKAKLLPKIISECLKIKTAGKGQKYYTYINRDENVAKYKRSESGRCDTHVKIDDDMLVINKLLAFDDLYYLDIIKQVNNIPFFIERHLDASPAYNPDPFIFKGFEELELGGIQNIPRAIHYLKKEHKEKFELLVNAFKQLFPRINEIDVREHKLNQNKHKPINISEDAPFMYTDSIYTMSVSDNLLIQPISFDRLSDGAKRIFLMLTYAIIADVKGLSMIAMEEPENSIHPGLFQSYLDILSQLVDKCKIIFTSHSPYVIQYLDPRSIYIGITREDGCVNFKRIAATKVNTLIKDATQYDRSIGDYIFNLLSNDDADEALSEYVES